MATTQSPVQADPVQAVTAASSRSHSRVASGELVVSALLRYGVTISLVLVVLGALLLLVTCETGYGSMGDLASLLNAQDAPTACWPHTPAAIVSGALALRPYAIILLGLLVLILTPVLRVAVSVLLFLYERDHTYVAITLFVLSVLVIGFLLGTPGEI